MDPDSVREGKAAEEAEARRKKNAEVCSNWP